MTLCNTGKHLTQINIPFFKNLLDNFPLSLGATDDGKVAVSGQGAVSGEADVGIIQESFLVGLGQSFHLLLKDPFRNPPLMSLAIVNSGVDPEEENDKAHCAEAGDGV